MSSSTSISKSRENKLLGWMKSDFSRLGCSQNNTSSLSRMDKQFIELIKCEKTLSDKEAIVDSICRFTLTLLFAMSSSTAILYNTYDHFKSLLEEEYGETGSEEKKEAMRMMHYQFTKIYDLKRRCQSMERLFRNLGSRSHNVVHKRPKKRKMRKLNGASSTEKTVRSTR